MEEYIGTVADRGLRGQLARALSGPKPFRRFTEVLRNTPSPEGGRYFSFYGSKLEAYAEEWLESLRVEYRWSEVSP